LNHPVNKTETSLTNREIKNDKLKIYCLYASVLFNGGEVNVEIHSILGLLDAMY